MQTARKVTLGISIAPQMAGTAVAVNGELVDWFTLSFKEAWSEQKPRKMWNRIKAIIKRIRATEVIMLMPVSGRSRTIAVIDEHLKSLANKGRISYEQRSLWQLKSIIGGPVQNKQELYGRIKERLGALEVDPAFTRPMLNQYHAKVIEAIGLVLSFKGPYDHAPISG